MKIANRLTIARLCLIPVFLIAYYMFRDSFFAWIPALIFGVASFTDFLDGYLARKRNEVTTIGKFMDPIADKVLVMAAFVVLAADGKLSAVSVIIFLSREFIISGFRQIAASKNLIISASKSAKIKTATQIVAILLLLLNNFPFAIIGFPMDKIAVLVALAFTLWSGVEYVIVNKGILRDENEG